MRRLFAIVALASVAFVPLLAACDNTSYTWVECQDHPGAPGASGAYYVYCGTQGFGGAGATGYGFTSIDYSVYPQGSRIAQTMYLEKFQPDGTWLAIWWESKGAYLIPTTNFYQTADGGNAGGVDCGPGTYRWVLHSYVQDLWPNTKFIARSQPFGVSGFNRPATMVPPTEPAYV